MRLNEKTGSIKHFIEYFYLISDSIQKHFLVIYCVRGTECIMKTSSGCAASTLQTWHSSASSFPVAKGKSWLLFVYLSWSFLIWSTITNIRAVGFSQKHSTLSGASNFLNSEKENWKFWRHESTEVTPALSSQALVGMGRGHRKVSLPTSLTLATHSSFHNING